MDYDSHTLEGVITGRDHGVIAPFRQTSVAAGHARRTRHDHPIRRRRRERSYLGVWIDVYNIRIQWATGGRVVAKWESVVHQSTPDGYTRQGDVRRSYEARWSGTDRRCARDSGNWRGSR